jgi:UDP-N-acetyl-D-galactosamine dehydrogenase
MNDSMGNYVAAEVVKLFIKNDLQVKNANILVLGITFKENCPDVRNTRVVDVIKSLKEFGTTITVFDPWANPAEVKNEYGIETLIEMPQQKFDGVVLAVSHKEFLEIDFNNYLIENGIVYDVKGVLTCKVDGKL